MKKAKLLGRKISDTGADQRHYRLEDGRFVVVSAVCAMFTGPETYIFEADAEGEITSWTELPGSFRGGLDHAEALRGYGYEIVEKSSEDDSTIAFKRAAIKSMEESEVKTGNSEENMRKVQDSVFSMQDGLSRTTIPHGCTVVNTFPGDLRDWFAGQAPQPPDWLRHSYVAHWSIEDNMHDAVKRLVQWRYIFADAMLAEREAKK